MIIKIDINKQIELLKTHKNKKDFGLFLIDLIKQSVKDKLLTLETGASFLRLINTIINPKKTIKSIDYTSLLNKKALKRYAKEIKYYSYDLKVKSYSFIANLIMKELTDTKSINDKEAYILLELIFKEVNYEDLIIDDYEIIN